MIGKSELNVNILKVKHTMVKNKTKQNISNDVFEMHEQRTADNVAAIKREYDIAVKDLEFFKEEVALRKGKNYSLEPKFAYEQSYEWKQYIERVTDYAHSQKVAEKEDKVRRLHEGFVCESARLKLIQDGVPAWEPTFDNERLKAEHEKQSSPE